MSTSAKISNNKKKFSRLEDYILIKTLGAGYNCKVKLAFYKKENKYYAAKIIRTKVHVSSNIKALKNEIAILTKFSHPNILKIKEYNEEGVYTKKNMKSYKTKYVILELANAGELFGYVAYAGRFEEKIARYYYHQLIEAIDYCHKHGITHRDLKPENLLLDDDFNLKISDFGFSTNVDRNLTSHVGTKLYMAPEMHISDLAYNGPAIDIFASGLILFTMYSGLQPYEQAAHPKDSFYKYFFTNNLSEYWQIVKSYMSKQVSLTEEFKGLISAILTPDPCLRPSIAEIKEHPWYKGPVATKEEVFEDLSKRRIRVDQEVEKQRLSKLVEKKKDEKLDQSPKKPTTFLKEAPQQGIGSKGFRTLEDKVVKTGNLKEEDQIDNKEISEFNEEDLPIDCEIRNYGLCDIVTNEKEERIFGILESLNANTFTSIKKNENNKKIKCVLVEECENLEIVEKITQINEGTHLIEFKRSCGNIKRYYEVVMKMKENIEKSLGNE